MNEQSPVLKRLLESLSADLGYPMDSYEMELYIKDLADFPISSICDLSLEILESGDYAGNHFPSLAFFKSQLGGKIKANQLKEELHGKTNDGLYDHSHIWRNG